MHHVDSRIEGYAAWWLLSVFALLIIAFAVALVLVPNQPKPLNKHLGQSVPTLALPIIALEGEPPMAIEPTRHSLLSLPRHANDLVLLHVWATWCSLCRHEHSTWLEIKAQYPGLFIAGLVLSDTPSAVRDYLQHHASPYDELLDDQRAELAQALGVLATPETFLIKGRTIVAHHYGGLTQEAWQRKFLEFMP